MDWYFWACDGRVPLYFLLKNFLKLPRVRFFLFYGFARKLNSLEYLLPPFFACMLFGFLNFFVKETNRLYAFHLFTGSSLSYNKIDDFLHNIIVCCKYITYTCYRSLCRYCPSKPYYGLLYFEKAKHQLLMELFFSTFLYFRSLSKELSHKSAGKIAQSNRT